MNNKGFLSIGFWAILIFLFAMFAVGQATYERNPDEDIYNITNTIFSDINVSEDLNKLVDTNITKENSSTQNINGIRIKNIIFKLTDTFLFTILEIAKWGMETGFNNPEHDYMFYAKSFTVLAVISILGISGIIVIVALIVYLPYKFIRFIRKNKEKKKNG